MTESHERLNIVLVSDHKDCMEVISAALKASNTRCRLMMIAAGPQTMPYLRREGRYAEAPRPHLILFDAVNADGRTVGLLRKIKGETALGSLPLVLLTSDESMHVVEDIRCGETRYTAFSPVNLDSFLDALNSINTGRFMQAIALLETFGFVLVRMPERAVPAVRSERARQKCLVPGKPIVQSA